MLIKAKANADVLALTNQIHKIDKELRIDIAEEDDFLKSNLASLHIFIVILSVLILIITSLLLMSNFEVFYINIKVNLLLCDQWEQQRNKCLQLYLFNVA